MDTLRTTGLRSLAIAVLLCTVPACALRSQSSLADVRLRQKVDEGLAVAG